MLKVAGPAVADLLAQRRAIRYFVWAKLREEFIVAGEERSLVILKDQDSSG